MRDGRFLVTDVNGDLWVWNFVEGKPDALFSINFKVSLNSAVLPESGEEVQIARKFLRENTPQLPTEIADILVGFI